jgi:tight adherence protein B
MRIWPRGWQALANMVEALIAGVCATGAVVLGAGMYRLRRRAPTARRVAVLLGETSASGQRRVSPSVGKQRRWRLDLRQAIAQIEAYDHNLQAPALGLACVCALIGLASVSPAWLLLAILAATAAYLLGGRERRRRRIEAQALGAMGLFASGLRAGYSVPQAIALVAKRSPEPTATEFGTAAQEISVGVGLADAIARLSKRTANSDYELVSIIIRVQHEVGGNLAQILDSVGATLRERFELRRHVEALTAQQRLSSIVLTILPFGLLTFLFVMDRSFVDPLFTQPIGRLLLALAGVMVFLGWTVMRSLGRVDV